MNTPKIDGLISQAAKTSANEDYEKLFSALREVELFFNVITSDGKSADSVDEGLSPVSTPLVDVGPGLRAVLFFTSNDNANLKRPFGGITWQKALEMVIQMPKADGLVIQNNDSAWIGLDKQRARSLLESFPS